MSAVICYCSFWEQSVRGQNRYSLRCVQNSPHPPRLLAKRCKMNGVTIAHSRASEAHERPWCTNKTAEIPLGLAVWTCLSLHPPCYPPCPDISPAKIPESILVLLIYLTPKLLKAQTSKEQIFPRIEYFSEYLHLGWCYVGPSEIFTPGFNIPRKHRL